MTQTITLERLSAIIDAYGSRAERWPAAERAAALDLLAQSPAAQARCRAAAELDTILDGFDQSLPSVGPSPLKQAILAAAPKPRRHVFGRLGPSQMVLAASLALGIVAGGWVGREYGSSDAASIDLAQAARLDPTYEAF